jgi:shikimate kinase
MIVVLNGWPGVGKLTVGLELASLLNGRLLDNHSVLNVAKLLTDYGSDAYYEAIRDVRDVAFRIIKSLPSAVPVIMTTALAYGGPKSFAEEYWASIEALASEENRDIFLVALTCDLEVQAKRIEESDLSPVSTYGTDLRL